MDFNQTAYKEKLITSNPKRKGRFIKKCKNT